MVDEDLVPDTSPGTNQRILLSGKCTERVPGIFGDSYREYFYSLFQA